MEAEEEGEKEKEEVVEDKKEAVAAENEAEKEGKEAYSLLLTKLGFAPA